MMEIMECRTATDVIKTRNRFSLNDSCNYIRRTRHYRQQHSKKVGSSRILVVRQYWCVVYAIGAQRIETFTVE